MERSGGIPPGSVDIKEGGADRSEKGMEPRDWGAGTAGSEQHDITEDSWCCHISFLPSLSLSF
jgi:hypothetical protein